MNTVNYHSLKEYTKTLGRIDHSKTTVDRNRTAWYNFYFNYFYDIVVNYFSWYNLPNDLDELFIERKLLENGHVAFFEDEQLGYVVQGGTRGQELNIYDYPTTYLPVNAAQQMRFPKMQIAYSKRDFDLLQKMHDETQTDKPCIVIPNNNLFEPYLDYIHLYCEKLADIEMTIQLNRNAQVTPFFVLADEKSVLSLKNIFNKIQSFEPVVYANTQKNAAGTADFQQLDDRIKVFRTEAPYLLDKLHDEKNRVINQLLTFIGINNNPVDKAERLVTAEAISNAGIISANIEVGWKSRRNAVKRINEAYGLNIDVEPAEWVQRFNFADVEKDLNTENLDDNADGGLQP